MYLYGGCFKILRPVQMIRFELRCYSSKVPLEVTVPLTYLREFSFRQKIQQEMTK